MVQISFPRNAHSRVTASLRKGALLLVISVPITNLHAQCGVPINTFPYNEDFEASAAWTSGGNSSDWAWGAPAHPLINTAGGGLKSWCVGGLSGTFYNLSELAYIESPCFDFTTLDHPWISFKIFWECERQYDGMTFQYSLNGGTTYSNVGAFGDPVDCMNTNWFNSSNITNLNGVNPKHGWSGRVGPTVGNCQGTSGSGGWVTASHCMSALANAPSVRFRFLFGAGTTCNNYDGIAIDDVLMQNTTPDQPVFNFTCNGDTLHLTDASPGCPSVYTWDFGDPGSGALNFSSVATPTHVYATPGTYNVTLTTSGPCNASGSVTLPVTILDVTVNVTNALCGGNTGAAQAVVNNGVGPFQYNWQPGGFTTDSVSGLVPGNYTVNVSAAGACATTVPFTITQPANALHADTTRTNVTCFGFSNGIAHVNVIGGTGPYAYVWVPLGGTTATANGLPAGAYTCTITDAANCVLAEQITIMQPSQLTVNTGANVAACPGAATTLTAQAQGGTGADTFTWIPAGPDVSPITTTTYNVYATDASGCVSDTTSITVNVGAAIQPLITVLDSSGCAPHCTSFIGAPVGLNYAWVFGDGSTDTVQNPAHCFNNAGIYTVSLTATDANGCTGTTVANDLVQAWPVPVAAFSASPSIVTISDPVVHFVDGSSFAANWHWNFGDGDTTGTRLASPTHHFGAIDCYTITLSVTSDHGCTDQSSGQLCVENVFTLYVPNAFSPNSDGINDVFGVVTSVNASKEFELLVFDRWGENIWASTDTHHGWDGSVGGSEAPIGVYVWKLRLLDSVGEGHEEVGRVMLVR